MKTNKISLLVLLAMLTLSCSLVTRAFDNSASPSDNSSNSGGSPTNSGVDFNAPANPINVSVTLDESSAASGEFTVSGGGTLSLTAPDGSEFTLAIPGGALNEDTLITLQSVKSLDGAPLDGAAYAVQMEPSGLIFNDFVTLTIKPAQDIPVKSQIVFGYEGSGEDFHFANVDPKSQDIKIRLLEFSGAGVGSTSDSGWAAVLNSEANSSRIRLANKFNSFSQQERQTTLLGEDQYTNEGGAEALAKQIQDTVDNFYDEVLRKDLAAAELDCRYAKKAAQDLALLNRTYGMYNDGAYYKPDAMSQLADLLDKAANCKKGYQASGKAQDITISGKVCGSLDTFFFLDADIVGGKLKFYFSPKDENGGNVTFNGGGGGFTALGAGPYTISGSGDDPRTLTMNPSGCVLGVRGSCQQNMTVNITLTPMETCGQ